MDVVQRLHTAMAAGLVDEDGDDVQLTLRPALTEPELSALRAQYPVPLPAELVALLSVTRGVDGLLDLDLTGASHSVEPAELMPAGLPVAADGFGNFWLLDLTPDTTDVAPVFFLGHDPAVLLYQAPDLATFVDEALRRFEPPHASLVDDVHDDRLQHVWQRRPGAIAQVDALSSTDVALRDFAQTLDDAWTLVDLRQRQVGTGVAWGRYGPRTRLARHGWERIFGYAPYQQPRRSWRRLGRRERL
jgi:SMI1 / KNR4 family (SUKH-1)